MIQFLHSDLWQKITSLAGKSKNRRIAVAYLGKGSTELLPLKRNDILIVNMSPTNVKNGQVNPFEIEKYNKIGVKIFNCKNLHSKVYLFDNFVIICSANISNNSPSPIGLVECGILTNDKKTLTATSKFIKELAYESVTKAYIDLCKKIYNPPKFKGGIKGKQLIKKPSVETSNYWVINVHPTTFTQKEDEILEKDIDKFKSKLTNRDAYEVTSVKFGASSSFIKNVKEGDLVMQIWNFKKRSKVQEPMRVLGVTKGRQTNSKGHGNMFLRIEDKTETLEENWTSFEKFLRNSDIKGITKTTTKQIKNEAIKRRLHNYWRD